MENLKHAQPHSSEGHQDQQGDHQEADAAPFPGALWLSPPLRYRWWEGSNRGCRRAGGTGVGTAVHPKYLWVHVVQVLLHGWEWDGLDVLCVIFHVAAKNCRGWPRLSPGGRPSSAFICLHHSSSEHPAQILQISMKASSRNSKPPKLPPSSASSGHPPAPPTQRQHAHTAGRSRWQTALAQHKPREAGAASEVLAAHPRAVLAARG